MNQGYLQGLHTHLGVKDDYNTWISAVKDNDDYLKGLHGHLGVKDNYDVWKTAIFDTKKEEVKKEEPVVEEVKTEVETAVVETTDEVEVDDEIEVDVEIPEYSTSKTFSFLQSDNKKEYDINIKNFFNADEEIAVPQLQKILGDDYEVSQSTINMTSDPNLKKYQKGLIGDLNYNAAKIIHKGTGEEIKINFGIGGLNYKELAKKLYSNDSKKLFDFVNKTMSEEGLSKTEVELQSMLTKYNELNAPPVIDETTKQVTKQPGPLYVSQEEKDNATNEFDAEDLFTPITTSKTTIVGREGLRTETKTTTKQPYEDELKTAKQELIDSGIKSPTQEEIEQQAISTLKQTAIQDLYDQKARDYMNSDKVEETDLNAILKLGALMAQKANRKLKKDIAENNLKLTNRIISFEKDMKDNNTQIGKALEFVEIASSTDATSFDVSNEEERVVLENGTIMSKVMYDDYMLSVAAYDKAYKDIEQSQEQLLNDISKVKSEDVKYDLVRRSYNDAEKFLRSVTGGFGDLAVKSAYGFGNITAGLVGIQRKNKEQEFIDWEESSSSLTKVREKFQKDIKFENAFNSKNMGRFLLQETQNQLPIFATLATGNVGIGILGLSSAQENWNRMVQEDEFYGSETSLLNKMLVSGGYGAAEIVFDRYLTLPVMRRSGKSLFGSMKKFREVTKPGMMQYTKQFGKRQLIFDPALETTSEVLTTGFQNIITGRPLTENMGHAAFSGGFFGTAFGHVPFYKGLVMSKFSDYNSYTGFRSNLNKLENLQISLKKLNTSLKANKTKGNDTSAIEGNIETVNQEITSLQQQNEGIIKSVEKKTNNLSKKWFNIYNDATVEQEQIRIDVEKLSKNTTLSKSEIQNLIDIKLERFNALQKTRDVLRDDTNFGNAYAAFRNSNQQTDIDRLQEIQGQATTEIINEGTLEPSDDAIDNRTRIIYNTQEINKDYNSKKSMLKGAGFKNFQNVEQAVNFVNKMDLSDADKQIIISNIEDGAHGVNIVETNGNITPMQVVENMAKADRLETRTHEIGHAVFAAAFGNNKKAFDDIADSVLEFVKQRNPSLHLKLLNQVERDAKNNLISEEVLTNFLELIAEGRINLNATKNKGLGAFIANALNLSSKKSLGENADFNFEGETDAINFLINLGKKIKAGTLTIKDIEAIERSKIAEKVDTKPETKFSKEASDNVQRIYNEQGEAGAMDIIDAFKPITNKLVQRRSEAPNFDRQLLTDEIETGKRGIFDLIQEYDPESGVPLAAYINKFLPSRAIEASKRVLGEEFVEDITEKVDIAAEEVTTEVKAKPKPRKIILSDRLGVKNKVDKAIKKKLPKLDIEKLNFKTLKDQTPEITGEMFGISPKKLVSLANITKKELQSAQMFINKNADILISTLPEGTTVSGTATGVPKTLLKEFYTKSDRAKMAKTGTKAGLAIQVKNPNITKKQFLEVFGIVDGKPDRTDRNTSARVLALANLVGKMMTNQAVRQELVNQGQPIKALANIADGKAKVMFSKNQQSIGAIDRSLNLEDKIMLWDNISAFTNEDILDRSLESIKIGLRNTYSNVPGIMKNIDELATAIHNVVKKLKDPIIKNPIKLTDKLIEVNNRQLTKVREFFNSDVTAADAFRDETRVKNLRATTSVLANKMFNPRNPGKSIAKIIAMKGHLASSSRAKHLDRKQPYPGNVEFLKGTLGSIPGIEYKIKTSYQVRKGKKIKVESLDKNSITYNGKSINIENITSAQTSQSAVNDAKDINKLNERSKNEDIALEMLDEITSFYTDLYNKGEIDNVDLMMVSASLLSNMDSVLARAAKLKYLSDNISDFKNPGKEVKYEHMQPRVVVLLGLWDAKINGDGASNIKDFLKNYTIQIIPNSMDDVITESKLGESLYLGQTLDMPSWIRTFNEKTIKNDGKRLRPLIDVYTKKVLKPSEAQVKAQEILSDAVDSKIKFSKAVDNARTVSEPRGITVLDFDDTLATTESLVKYTTPEGETGTLNAEEYANTYQDLLEQGYKFDFSEFNKVVKGKLAPLFNKAMKLQKKFGSENMFVLTARPAAAQKAIFDFLKANGLNIPIKNITGLGNSTSEAKALWIADKVGEGYNDFYFADDALQNVQAVDNMLSQFDVKRKVQQAKIQFSKNAGKEFNNILEQTKGMSSDYIISQAKARQRGKKKGLFQLFVPPSADDFAGLLQMFQGKGKQGMEHAAWFKKNLLDPFARGDRSLNGARQRTAEEFKALRKKFPKVSKNLRKVIPTGDYTYGDAVRVYLWDKNGIEVPGLTKTDQNNMLKLVKADPELQSFADVLGIISRKEDGYISPDEYWMTKDIVADITEDGVLGDGRKDHLAEWIENKDLIFTPENLNKIEFLYGSNFREALEDILYRMENGTSRPAGSNRIVNNFLNWMNGGISVVMNWNTRSAVLQTLSTINFINWGDNNILAAAKAFANQKQFWKDFAYIFNSDMLKQRRAGLKTSIESSELMSEVEGAVNPVRATIRYLLRVGFTPTKIADSFAIAMGGASFYRNRINTYKKQGYSQAEAEAKAFLDFQETTEEAQQSSRPDRLSQQQTSVLGRFILAFANTPMQYVRLSKKEILDLVNGRFTGFTGPNSFSSKVGKIMYYTAIQNLIFYSMQTALFAAMFSDEEDDEEFFDKKAERIFDNMADGVLRGMGVGGAVVSTIKNIILKYIANKDSKMYDESAILMEGLKLSPPLSIKARQLLSADKTMRYNKDVIKQMETFDIDNPMWNAAFNVVELTTNAPLSRMESKYKNVRNALDNQYETWQRIAFMLGYNNWSLGLKNEEIEEIKKEIKAMKTFERKKKAQEKKQKEQAEKQAIINKKVEKEKKLQEKGKLKDPKCRYISTKGNRCKKSVSNAGDLCTIHEEVPQRADGKKTQCKKVKADGKKCKMKTSNKSGYCYYHD